MSQDKQVDMHSREIRYSQNFIESEQLVNSLVESTDVNKNDTVIEIGPGKGTITKVLSKKAGRVIAVERDEILAKQLLSSVGLKSNVSVISADFLKYPLPAKEYKVVANIPFNITAEIMNKLFYGDDGPTSAFLIMQEEAAQTYCGYPKESLKSIFLQIRYKATVLRRLNRAEFNPRPSVDAAFIAFEKKLKPEVAGSDLKEFQDLVAFGYVHNAWNKSAPLVLRDGKVFTTGQIDYLKGSLNIGNRKINELTITDWIEIYASFKNQVRPENKRVIGGSFAKLKKEQSVLPKEHRTRRY